MSCHAPTVHSVHVYDADSALIDRLCGIVSSSLRIGNSVLIVATPEHREQLVRELSGIGIDIRSQAREGRFSMLDAQELLRTFMVNGMPSRDLFLLAIGTALEDARRKSRGAGQGVTVFGEMVAVLWDQGNKQGALEVEELWNQALRDQTFHLHCAYPRSGFVSGEDELAVCSSHSHVVS
ncbi:MAG TPA: MEDS domain-containing protein [Terriglobales bacterium]|nr:MEDS domain-containing protein [Terriglobales bacterium]